jgi:uncharacterized membrane-anchored protein
MHTLPLLLGGTLLITAIIMLIPSPISLVGRLSDKPASQVYRLILLIIIALSGIGFLLTSGLDPIALIRFGLHSQ